MKISSTNSIKENKIKALVAGFSGAGKTYQASLLKNFKTLVISAESGLLSIAGKGVDYIDISKDDAGKVIPKELRINRLMEVYRYILTPEAMAKYDLLYIDSLTELSQVLYDYFKKEYPERKDSLVLFGELGQKTRDMIKSFRDVPHYHVIFTCLTVADKDETTGRRFANFDLVGGIKDRLAQFFDAILYLRINQDGGREFVCNATDSVTAKDRSGRLSPVEPPDLGAVLNKMLQSNETKKESK